MMLVAIAVIPLLAAAVAALGRRAGGAATLVGALAVLALSARAALQVVSAPAHALAVVPHWVGLDALGALILLLVAFVGAAAALYSLGYMKSEGMGALRRYYVNFNLFLFSMLLVPLMQEPNLAWIAVELTTLFSVLLVGFRKTPEAIEAAWKYVVLTIMGASIALLGFVVLFWAMRAAGGGVYSWDGLLAAAPRLRREGRPGAAAHLAAGRPQPGAHARLRAALRRRDDGRPLRYPAPLSRDGAGAR